MIKRIIGAMLLVAFTSISVPSYAREAVISLPFHNIYIEGETEGGIDTVTMTFAKGSEIGHIAEINVNEDNTYSYKFKFEGNYSDYTLKINDGAENLTETVTGTAVVTEGLLGTVKITDKNATAATVDAEIINKLADEGSSKLIFASYDAEGRLLGVTTEELEYDYLSGAESVSGTITGGAYEVKVFMWNSMSDCVPLAIPDRALPEKEVILIGDSLGQGYDASFIREGWGDYLGDYMAYGATINNQCHASWCTNTYIASSKGWGTVLPMIDEGDIVIFGIGYNDYTTMGYEGEYKTAEGVYYHTDANVGDGDNFEQLAVTNGKVTIGEEQIALASGINNETSRQGMMTYLYKDEGNNLSSYAADAYYDNMKIMLDDCKKQGAEVIIRTIAAAGKGAMTTSANWYGSVTHALINNEVLPQLATEYDNVTLVDLYTETYNHFNEFYNNASAPEKIKDADGSEIEYLSNDGRMQALRNEYWITLKNLLEFYQGSTVAKQGDKWGVMTGGGFVEQDTLHYNARGADYIARATAKLIAESESPVSGYFIR